MENIRKYWPILVLVLLAATVTGLAGYRALTDPALNTIDSNSGFYLWLTPAGYLGLVWLLNRKRALNKPYIALIALPIYALSAVLLFLPALPAGLQWHYPMGIAAIVCLLFGRDDG